MEIQARHRIELDSGPLMPGERADVTDGLGREMVDVGAAEEVVEPPAAKAKPAKAKPAKAKPAKAKPPPTTDLARVKGIGPTAAAELAAAGVDSLAALAALDDDAVGRLPQTLQGRVRDAWRPAAAELLAKGAAE